MHGNLLFNFYSLKTVLKMKLFQRLLQQQWAAQYRAAAFFKPHSQKVSTFPCNVDRYKGVHVDLTEPALRERKTKPYEFEDKLKGKFSCYMKHVIIYCMTTMLHFVKVIVTYCMVTQDFVFVTFSSSDSVLYC